MIKNIDAYYAQIGSNLNQNPAWVAYFNTYKSRVETDGGTVDSYSNSTDLYKHLVENVTYDDTLVLWSGEGGLKVREDGVLDFAEKAYDFSTNDNDLTQTTYGFSRDDAGRFLGEYVRMGIYEYDPFQVLDQDGIGKLVKMACKLGRKTRPKIKLGICGEHGGDPMTVRFCHGVGLNYVSCSPYRVPIARLAAAQAALDK